VLTILVSGLLLHKALPKSFLGKRLNCASFLDWDVELNFKETGVIASENKQWDFVYAWQVTYVRMTMLKAMKFQPGNNALMQMTCTKVSAGDALWESLCKAETVVLLSAG
jgi:hypothetical protein